MAPTRPGGPPDYRPPHRATVNTIPGETVTPYIGMCGAYDFHAAEARATQAEARADVQAHLDGVAANPHRAFANYVGNGEWVGFCAAGDFSPRRSRESPEQAEADIASHLSDSELSPGEEGADGSNGGRAADASDRSPSTSTATSTATSKDIPKRQESS